VTPSPAEWAHAAFARGYAEDGRFPISVFAQSSCLALQEAATAFDSPAIAPLIIEAGRVEGKRSSRERAHRALYSFHAEILGAAWDPIFQRVDVSTVAGHVVQHAAIQTSAGVDPVTRRRAVQGIALTAIAAQITPDDRQTLDGLNAIGWAHADAYGQAEAQATPAKGGPPDPKAIAALATTALTQIDSSTAEAASQGWTDLQMRSIAMGAALAAGNGADVGAATRSVTSALVDSGRATRTYANQLHEAVGDAYVARTQAENPGVWYDWLTADDPCPECEDNAISGPYQFGSIPTYPAHPGCLCDLEVALEISSRAALAEA
jgi:hypothetical protein